MVLLNAKLAIFQLYNGENKLYLEEIVMMYVDRHVFNDYRDRSPGAVTNMIDTLQWDSLACRRTKASLILLYKINEGLVEVPTTMLSQSDRRTRGAHTFRQFSQIKIFISFLSFLIQYQFGTVYLSQ